MYTSLGADLFGVRQTAATPIEAVTSCGPSYRLVSADRTLGFNCVQLIASEPGVEMETTRCLIRRSVAHSCEDYSDNHRDNTSPSLSHTLDYPAFPEKQPAAFPLRVESS